MNYPIFVRRVGDIYLVDVPDFPGIAVEGPTFDQAVASARNAIELQIDDYREQGRPLPEPSTEAVALS